IIIAVVGLIFFGKKPVIEYTAEEVKQGKLTQTVSATGNIESSEEINLNFKNNGKLIYLKVGQGGRVKAGEVLGRVDTSHVAPVIAQERANVAAAQANLAKVLAGASPEDINVLERQTAKAVDDLANLKSESAEQLNILKEKNLDSINNAVFTVKVALNKIFNYFINRDLISNLLVNNTELKNRVESDYYNVSKNFNIVVNNVDSVNNGKDSQLIIERADKLKIILTDLNNLLDNSYNLANAIMLNAVYSQTEKDAIKSDINAEQSTNNASLNALQTAKSNLANNINSYDSQIRAAENSLAISKAQLDLKKAGPRAFDLAAARAQVAQAQAQLDQALVGLKDYAIIAPIDGTVIQVNYKLGEQTNFVSSGQDGLAKPAIKILGNEKFQIKVNIPESDIAKVKIGDKAIIQLDAFGADHIFSGTVTFIDPAQTTIQDVVYYQTTVGFNSDSWNERVKSGMTSDVTIKTAEKDNVLYIPQRAVKVRETTLGEVAEKYVAVLQNNNQTVEKKITIGLRGDNGLVEVISGLAKGEKVITFKKEAK
ncbi:efflux RND transporter periplasmic adaptor subunit, partial [Candidatus Falkowbacteria bacterium]|nr:efflux RND transporter periplasmic adaptor subunit [Candidatus Falkowbacteria bacterium]